MIRSPLHVACITCNGETLPVIKRISEDIHLSVLADLCYVDIEFLDDKGNYHHWKSENDGGHCVFTDGQMWYA